MAKKCKCPPEGAPEWVVTYGDMMSLLLTFFILLVALSEIKTEQKWRAIVDEVHRAFGRDPGGGKEATRLVEMPLTTQLAMLEVRQHRRKRVADVQDPAVQGRQPRVTQVREGKRFVVGGSITFEPGSADLSDEATDQLFGIAQLIRGHQNKVELRGHAGSLELTGESRFNDLWTLSYARSLAVMRHLTHQLGVQPERIRIVANAQQEPIRQGLETLDSALAMDGQKPNRRVEIVVTDALVKQFNQPEEDQHIQVFD